MSEQIIITVDTEDSQRADKFLSSKLEDFSSSAITNLIESGNAVKNGEPIKKNTKLKFGDEIQIVLPDLAECEAKGVRLIDKATRPGADGKMIAFLHPKSTAGVLTELCEG